MKNDLRGYLFLDETTDFKGEVEAAKVILKGKINGSIHTTGELVLKRGSYVEGEIHTGKFTIEQGASCKSEIHIDTQNIGREYASHEKMVSPIGTKYFNGWFSEQLSQILPRSLF